MCTWHAFLPGVHQHTPLYWPGVQDVDGTSSKLLAAGVPSPSPLQQLYCQPVHHACHAHYAAAQAPSSRAACCRRYARVAKQSRMQWLRACEELCLYRPTLLSVLLLVDSSLPAKEVDLDAAQWFAEHAVPFSVLFTKADKKKAGCPAPRDNIAAFRCVTTHCGAAWRGPAVCPAMHTSAVVSMSSHAGDVRCVHPAKQCACMWPCCGWLGAEGCEQDCPVRVYS